jgi:hypothetical protein
VRSKFVAFIGKDVYWLRLPGHIPFLITPVSKQQKKIVIMITLIKLMIIKDPA